MKRSTSVAAGILTAASLALVAASAHAHPGEGGGMQHRMGGMEGRGVRMAAMHGMGGQAPQGAGQGQMGRGHGAGHGGQGAGAQAGCPMMSAPSGTQGERKE